MDIVDLLELNLRIRRDSRVVENRSRLQGERQDVVLIPLIQDPLLFCQCGAIQLSLRALQGRADREGGSLYDPDCVKGLEGVRRLHWLLDASRQQGRGEQHRFAKHPDCLQPSYSTLLNLQTQPSQHKLVVFEQGRARVFIQSRSSRAVFTPNLSPL